MWECKCLENIGDLKVIFQQGKFNLHMSQAVANKMKQAKTKIKKALEKITKLHFITLRYHGHRDYTDIERSGCAIKTVFDVGANIGQSALKFRAAFPDAQIFSFEPVSDTFIKLSESVSMYSNITCHKIALGNEQSTKTMYLSEESLTNSMVRSEDSSASEEIMMSTVDDFSTEHKVSRIDLLKIDAEGYDLQVLKGATEIITSQKVPFILVEAGFHPGDDRHVLFDEIRAYLLPLGYSVFGIYDQQLEWSGEQQLRFANVCFCNASAFS